MENPAQQFIVAPLNIGINRVGISHGKRISVTNFQRPQLASKNRDMITPPITPQQIKDDKEELEGTPTTEQRPFIDYLRACYPYYPPYDATSETVTLPLNAGDIILIHSVDANGWADGTLLNSGLRGWLPTNFCEAYDIEPMQNLLTALTNLFDLVRSGTDEYLVKFYNQDYTRAMVAGVRYLLERIGCLSREAVTPYVDLSRNRKALLSDLSGLVKLAKALEVQLQAQDTQFEVSEELVNDLILRAFKLVLRAVKLHDVWHQMVSVEGELKQESRQDVEQSQASRSLSTLYAHAQQKEVRRESATICQVRSQFAGSDSMTRQDIEGDAPNRASTNKRQSSDKSPPAALRASQQLSRQFTSSRHNSTKTLTARQSLQHRISQFASLEGVRSEHLASQRLTDAHDCLLECLGNFLTVHVSSRTSAGLIAATQESLATSKRLIAVLETIWQRGYHGSESIQEIHDDILTNIMGLIEAVQTVFRSLKDPDDISAQVLIGDRTQLTDAATECIKCAGMAVHKGRYVLQMIGDFEFEVEGSNPSVFSGDEFVSAREADELDGVASEDVHGAMEAISPPSQVYSEAPAPPVSSRTGLATNTDPTSIGVKNSINVPDLHGGRMSASSWLAPLPTLASPVFVHAECAHDSPVRHSFIEVQGSPERKVSQPALNRISGSTFAGSRRDSERSLQSSASTCATSFGSSISTSKHQHRPSIDEQVQDTDSEEAEEKVMEKTFAHELMFSKEGQIVGGTLEALVERLTVADCTPDAFFVSTFFLTFRLFATPITFAQSLIDRFVYVGRSRLIATPVRLRVYNVFKRWLEASWIPGSDAVALEIIRDFATGVLTAQLPSAGKRLLELADMVEAAKHTATPKLGSAIAKTSTSAAQTLPQTIVPAPVLTKSQLNMLSNWKHGGITPSILDFDPLELARQFTVKVSTVFCAIRPEELLATEWNKKTGSTAVNVRALATLSTDLANLVADCILSLEDPHKRAKLIKQWVKIAAKCLALKNFDSLMAILATFDSTTILRLKRTWDYVSPKTKATLDELKSVVGHSRNFRSLRRRLEQLPAPCLPFIGIYLTDLTFVDAGNCSTRVVPGTAVGGQTCTATRVINFHKHVKTVQIISELQRFQVPFRLQEVPELQTWIQDQLVRVRSQEETQGKASGYNRHYRRSLALEPRQVNSVMATGMTSPVPSVSNMPGFHGQGITSKANSSFQNMFGRYGFGRRIDEDGQRPSVAGGEGTSA